MALKFLKFVILSVLAFIIQPAAFAAGDECLGETLNDDTITVSFMTCDPGTEIYALYGHSAIRIRTASGADWVFNYGMFDFHTSNFVGRFVLGKTDYYMAAFPFEDFISEYEYRGSAVTEQILNLTKEEKEKLLHSLVKISRYEEWTYRYNFLYDNCTTRARDQIENCVNGKITYPKDETQESYRQIIHRYTKDCPWSEFGQDLLLGSDADKYIGERQKMFAPLYMKKYIDKAYITDKDGNKRKLVADTKIYPPIKARKEIKGFPVSPIGVFGTILALTMIICALEIKWNKIFWGYEAVLMTIQGLAGCIIATLFFFSEHPTVNSNWLIAILNPIPIIYMVIRMANIRKHKYDNYAPIAAGVIFLFIVVSLFISQTFSASVYCFALSLCLQTATSAYIQHKAEWKKSK